MELKEYFRIIGRHWLIFVAAIVVICGATIIFTLSQPKTYLASTVITVNKSSALKQSQVGYYLYDNYYNVQSSGLFSQIVTTWFSSAAVVKEIYEKAGVPVPNTSQAKLAKTFRAVRAEPATITVSLVGTNRDEVSSLINAAADEMQQKANELGRADKENVYDLVKFNPIITDNSSGLIFNTIVSFIVGLLFGLMLALSVEYFKRS